MCPEISHLSLTALGFIKSKNESDRRALLFGQSEDIEAFAACQLF